MKPRNLLTINQLELDLFLGWPDEERMRRQHVHFNIEIEYPDTPKACETDHLDDTVCYRALIEKLRSHLTSQKFHLIEHVTAESAKLIKTLLPPNSSIRISLTKRPLIEGLASVTFHYTDKVNA